MSDDDWLRDRWERHRAEKRYWVDTWTGSSRRLPPRYQRAPGERMSTGRVLWILWCCGWAGTWIVSAIDYYSSPANPVACVLYGTACHQSAWVIAAGIVASVASLAAIRLPVG